MGLVASLSLNTCQNSFILLTVVTLSFRPLRSKRILRDPGAAVQSSSKVLKHFPNVDLGITVVSVLQNTRGSILRRERAHYSEKKSVRSKNLKNFPENSRETVSVSTICDQYCSWDDSIVPSSCPWASEDVLSVIIVNLSEQQNNSRDLSQPFNPQE